MAQPNTADLAVFKNQQIQINEQIAVSLWHLEALMDVILTVNLFELTKTTMHCYFSVIADLIKDIAQLNQTHLILLHDQ